MKRYVIKTIDAWTLYGSPGLKIVPSGEQLSQILVLDGGNRFGYFVESGSMSRLPKSCNTELVCTVLSELQRGHATSKMTIKLKEYLQYAEKKDKNNEIKSGIKQAIKRIFFGLFFVVAAITGCMLMLMLIGLYPVNASWLSLLAIPIVAVATYGIIDSLIGVIKLGFGIFSFCFHYKNRKQLLELENALHRLLNPPSYLEAMANAFPTAPALNSKPPTYDEAMALPTYQQAIMNENSSTPANISSIYVGTSLEYSAGFFQPLSNANNRLINLDSQICSFSRT